MKLRRERLQNLGLSEKEAQTYLALLEIGAATAEMLSRTTKINRSTTYVQLETLMKLGLVTSSKKGKKTVFVVESPRNLSRLIETQEEEMKQRRLSVDFLLPDLLQFYGNTGVRPIIRAFEGIEALRTVRNEVLKTKEKDICMVFSFDYLWKLFTWDELMAFSNERARRGIRSTIIYNKDVDDVVPVPPQRLRWVPKDVFPIESDIYIYDNKVAVASTRGHISGVVIESEMIAKTISSVFNLAWETAAKYNLNKEKELPVRKRKNT